MTDIPKNPGKFKQWADEACRKWPGNLTQLAFAAHLGLVAGGQTKLEEFKAAYAARGL